VAGIISGVFTIVWVLCAVRLVWTPLDVVTLFAALVAASFLISIIPVMLLRRYLSPTWAGLLSLGFVYGGEWWFRAAAPHTDVFLWKGTFFGWFLISLSIVGLGWALRFVWVRKAVMVSGVIGWAFFLQTISPEERGVGDGPNVLVVSVDTLRADHVGAWTNTERHTPVIDELARTGARFSSAYAPIAVTGPSHAAMFTGAGPWRTEMLLNGLSLPPKFPLVSEQLLSSGYRTGAFVSAYVLEETLGFGRGFEVYDDDFGSVRGWSRTGPGRIQAMVQRHFSPQHVVERKADATVEQALAWLNEPSDAPFFAWVHLFDPHGPYVPPPPFDSLHYAGDPRGEQHESMEQVTGVADYLLPSLEGIRDVDWVLAQYAGEVSFVDQQIGRLMEMLAERGLTENTLVVVVGDHGESLGENQVWFNHGGDLDASALHVPLLMRWPEAIEGGQIVDSPVGVVDVAPTILGLLSLSPPDLDGVDLSVALRGGTVDRGPVRALCYDRSINQVERAEGLIDKPTHLLARSWGPTGWFQIGTHPTRGAIQFGTGDREELQSLVEVLGSIGVGVHERADVRTEDTILRLKALGYTE